MDSGNWLHSLQNNRRWHAYIVKVLLVIPSYIYQIITSIRGLLYDWKIKKAHKLPTLVISVGNITAGGTGKTPTVIWLVRHLQQLQSNKPIILSRGYGQDEAKLFSKALPDTPHFMNSKRFLAGQEATAKYGTEVIFVLDDGFQHRQLQREVDIVLIDAMCPFGYNYVLPRGFLRESLTNLKRADIIIITRSDMITAEQLEKLKIQLQKRVPEAVKVCAIHKAIGFLEYRTENKVPPQNLQDKKAVAFCGIGNPQSFIDTLHSLKIDIVYQHYFADHQQYTQQDMDMVNGKARENQAQILVTTSKDAVKLAQLAIDIPVWVLEIDLYIEDNEKILAFLKQRLKK